MTEQKPAPTRGGRRPGSGPKRSTDPLIAKEIGMRASLIAAVKASGPSAQSFAELTRQLIVEGLASRQEGEE